MSGRIDFRRCSRLWMEDPDGFTSDELQLLDAAFKKGLAPLGDQYSDSNHQWAAWKEAVNKRINNGRTG